MKSRKQKDKLPRWQREQRTRKLTFFKRLFKTLFLIIFFLAMTFLIFKFWQAMRVSRFAGKDRVTFVFSAENIFVISLDPKEGKMMMIKIPPETQIDVAHGYGKYRAGAVYKLGEEEKIGGGKILAESVQEYMGIVIDGYLRAPEAIWILGVGSEEELGRIDFTFKKKMSQFRGFIKILGGNFETNFSKFDLIKIWREILKVRPDRVVFVDLAQSFVSWETVLPDGQKSYEVEPEMLEQIVKKNFLDEKIREENFLVEVTNTTLHSKLADKAARILTNIGVDVVAVSETEEKLLSCQVVTDKKFKNSYTVKKIRRIFDCHFREGEIGGRADITVKIGEDYYKKLNLK
jgi:hypothetical protein